MENIIELNLTPLSEVENEEINGGLIPAIYAAVVLTQHAVAIYGATKVATAAGTVVGIGIYTYANS